MSSPAVKQGASAVTVRKELEIGGIAAMRFHQFKAKAVREKGFFKLLVADVFSGDGRNFIPDLGGVDGSPVKLAEAYRSAVTKGKIDAIDRLRSLETEFVFSDIRPEAVERCKVVVDALDIPFLKAHFHVSAAADMLRKVGEWLHYDHRRYAMIVVDPNGPSEFPHRELLALTYHFWDRIDVIPNISATSIKRCLGAYRTGHMATAAWWIREIQGFDAHFIRGLAYERSAWIREPISGDRQQWFMLPSYGFMPPRNDWSAQGYVKVDSARGRYAIEHYTTVGEKK